MEPCDLLEQYRSHRFHELPGQIGFRNPVYYGQELGVIWNTLDILYKYCIATGALKRANIFETNFFEICLAWATVYLDYPGDELIEERIKERRDSQVLGIHWMSEDEPEEMRESFHYYVSWFLHDAKETESWNIDKVLCDRLVKGNGLHLTDEEYICFWLPICENMVRELVILAEKRIYNSELEY